MILAFIILCGGIYNISDPQEKNFSEEEIKEVATSFHDWYIEYLKDFDSRSKESYASSLVQVVEGKDGKSRLTLENYVDKLEDLGTISQKFIEKERLRVAECSQFLSTVDWEDFQKAEGYEYDEKCGFFYHYYWLRSQEMPDKVKAFNVEKKDNHWSVCLKFLNIRDGKEYLGSSYQPKVKVEDINGVLKITDIK
ncbi:hypothetical protein WJR50_28675 [Catalinimonas sp. 4WD22]|uniref:hypothetical protein n=1 Tax=Catalinimonas locisalis TaxID=3133978 RepID=UPI0031013CED